jgi:hypothetical protein
MRGWHYQAGAAVRDLAQVRSDAFEASEKARADQRKHPAPRQQGAGC